MKRISALLAVLCMMVLWVFPAGAASYENANSWRYSGGQPLPSPINEWGSDLDEEEEEPKPFHPGATLVGIDVSHHQGKIDWAAVAADGIKFAILRCGYGENLPEQDDRYFEYNAAECQRLGIPYGVYLYSYATDAARAELEADHVLRLIKGKSLSYPVYFDMEDNSVIGCDYAAIATAFCNKISAAGYPVGVYANRYWWTNYLTDPIFNTWHRWVAQYGPTCTVEGSYQIWQYTSSGTVSGIEGNVDMNFQISYPKDHGPCSVSHDCEPSYVAPTCIDFGYTVYTCKVCGTSFIDDYEEPIGHAEPHENTTWIGDFRDHWYLCDTCGGVVGTEPHNFEDEVNSPCTVCGYRQDLLPGDLNDDDTVDDRDVSLLLWHTLFPESFEILGEGDCNGDGQIDDADVAYLLWHTLFPEQYPL